MINHFGEKAVSSFTIGMGVSGLVLIVFRALSVLLFGDDPSNYVTICMYIALTVVFLLIDISLNERFVFPCRIYQNKFGSKN